MGVLYDANKRFDVASLNYLNIGHSIRLSLVHLSAREVDGNRGRKRKKQIKVLCTSFVVRLL